MEPGLISLSSDPRDPASASVPGCWACATTPNQSSLATRAPIWLGTHSPGDLHLPGPRPPPQHPVAGLSPSTPEQVPEKKRGPAGRPRLPWLSTTEAILGSAVKVNLTNVRGDRGLEADSAVRVATLQSCVQTSAPQSRRSQREPQAWTGSQQEDTPCQAGRSGKAESCGSSALGVEGGDVIFPSHLWTVYFRKQRCGGGAQQSLCPEYTGAWVPLLVPKP